MQKTLIFSALLLFNVLAANGASFTGAISSNTTWTKTNSPYVITGNVSVDEGATLTIEPGVIIKFTGYYTFYVSGRLVANGTANENITFTSGNQSPSQWPGIEFRARTTSADSSLLQYCNVYYAEEAVHILGSYVVVNNCSIQHNKMGIDVDQEMKQPPVITNNNISFNYYGLFGGSKLGGSISYCTFANNKYAIYLNQFSLYTISYDQILFNTEGIYCSNSVMPRIIGNTILSNTGNGVFLGAGGLIDSMAFNTIAYNGKGIYLSGTTGKICHNTVTNNGRGIEFNYFMNIGLTIEYNCINSNTDKDFVNNGPYDVIAPNNYWNANDSQAISARVLDHYDNAANGKILFVPFLTSSDTACKTATQPTAINEVSNTNALFKVYPNPVTDQLNLEFDHLQTKNFVIITDVMGKTVYNNTINTSKLAVDVSQWPAGIYMLRCQEHTMKFVKQ